MLFFFHAELGVSIHLKKVKKELTEYMHKMFIYER